MGNFTAALRNRHLNGLLSNTTNVQQCPQQEMQRPLAPVRRGPDWGADDLERQNGEGRTSVDQKIVLGQAVGYVK
jgi:hypothetical protein